MIGQILDQRYRILRKLGEGGMGEVYLAEHINLGRREALKILHPSLAGDSQFVSRFRREARAVNRLQHPNIVAVHDFGKLEDGRFYLTMEYAQGERLDAVLARLGALPVPRALHVLHQLADAVDHAHSRGVVHRDLKPENLMLVAHRGKQDVLKILDFGIAKIVAPDYNESRGLTQKGAVFGTAAYMSPEQFRGENADPRSDIYSIGCIAFELLVGEPPFAGRTMELAHAHTTRKPDVPSRRRPQASIPAPLDALVSRCLDKEPKRRYQTGRELLVAIECVPGFGTQKSSTPRRHSQRKLPALAPDFECEATDVSSGEPSVEEAPTLGFSCQSPEEQARQALRAVVRELSEALLDVGHRDYQLVIGVAQLKELEDELARNDTEAASIDLRNEEIEQAARERQGALRFALGELRYERAQALARGERVAGDLDFQIGELERRLAQISREAERELNGLTDRAVALAAARARTEEKLDQLYAAMERLVDEIIPRYESSPTVGPLVFKLRTVRAPGS